MKESDTHCEITPVVNVQVVGGRTFVSSLQVAEHFDKRHKNVMRAIHKILEQVPDWHRLNFEPVLEVVKRPDGSTLEIPAFNMTRDGFVLLAMGFTGEKAFEFKIGYMEAFNAMEVALTAKIEKRAIAAEKKIAALTAGKQKYESISQMLDNYLEGLEQKRQNSADSDKRSILLIEGLLAYWAYLDNLDLEVARNIFFTCLNIFKWEDVAEKFEDARNFLLKVIHKPMKHGLKATKKQYEAMLSLAAACSALRWSKGTNHLNIFLNKYGNTIEDFDGLSEVGARKYIHLLYAHLMHEIANTGNNSEFSEFLSNAIQEK